MACRFALPLLMCLLTLSHVAPRLAVAQCQYPRTMASDAAPGAWFGFTVAIDEDLAAVGAHRADSTGIDSGTVYVYRLVGDDWIEEGILNASDASGGDHFGYSVAVHRGTIVVGAPQDDASGSNSGSAYVFEQEDGAWVETQKLVTGDAAANDQFGYSLALGWGRVVVGAIGANGAATNSGAAYVFDQQSVRGAWSETRKLWDSGGNNNALFGEWVAIDGDRIAVGATHDDTAGFQAGAVLVYSYVQEPNDPSSPQYWAETAKIVSPDAAANQLFGESVSISGSTLAVGSFLDGGSGAAFIFDCSGDTWQFTQKLTAPDAEVDDWFGFSLSLRGDQLLVGSRKEDAQGVDSGSAYMFARDGSWSFTTKLQPPPMTAGSFYGTRVAIARDYAICGARQDDTAGADSGAAYLIRSSGVDADDNGQIDRCQIAEDPLLDANQDGYLDSHENVIFVNGAVGGDCGTGPSAGTSWSAAFSDLMCALAVAGAGDKIWVAAGTYLPDEGTGDRSRSFLVPAGVTLLGGFDGTEVVKSERDPGVNVTVLSGDLAGDDGTPAGQGDHDNSFHVVSIFGARREVVVDGFTITGGHADTGDAARDGGGVLVIDSVAHLRSCRIIENCAGKGLGTLAPDEVMLVGYDTGSGAVHRIDPGTGSTMALVSTTLGASVLGGTSHPTPGVFFATTGSQLVRVSAVTGGHAVIGTYSGGFTTVTDLGYDHYRNILYGTDGLSLFVVDTETATTASPLGMPGPLACLSGSSTGIWVIRTTPELLHWSSGPDYPMSLPTTPLIVDFCDLGPSGGGLLGFGDGALHQISLGGGIVPLALTSLQLTALARVSIGCQREDPLVGGSGAGVAADQSSLELTQCTIADNTAGRGRHYSSYPLLVEGSGGHGGGVSVKDCRLTVHGSTVTGNESGSPFLGPPVYYYNSETVSGGHGAGLYLFRSQASIASSTISSNTTGFGGSEVIYPAGGSGGGIASLQSFVTVQQSLFQGNRTNEGGGPYTGAGASGNGAGLFARDSYVHARHSTWLGNQTAIGGDGDGAGASGSGGGIYFSGTVLHVDSCQFVGNHAANAQEGFLADGLGGSGGGVFAYAQEVVLVNSTFLENRAGQASNNPLTYHGGDGGTGGAAWIDAPSTLVKNCTVVGNSAGLAQQSYYVVHPFYVGGLGFPHAIPAEVSNTICYDNWSAGDLGLDDQVAGSFSISYCCVEHWTGGSGSISTAPQFVDPLGPDGQLGTGDEDFRLLPTSPCIDAGNNDLLPLDASDLDDDGNTTEPLPVDLFGSPRLWDAPVPDTGNGSAPIVDIGAYEWHPDCNGNDVADTVDLATGTSLDCDANGLPDECDIAAGLAQDCDGDLVPDSCQIASGDSRDRNANAIPDECELNFVRGDCNGDGTLDLSDPIFLLGFLFGVGNVTSCIDACDANDFGGVDLVDAAYLLASVFSGTPLPAYPFPECGVDPSADIWGCAVYPHCP